MSGSEKYLIGLDLGTSAVKGVLLSEDGSVVSTAEAPREYHCYGSGCVEFDAEGFYETAADTVRRLAAELPRGGTVAALAMASASGNTLLADGFGKPLAPAISWLDARVTDEMDRVFGALNAREIHQAVGWPLLKRFPLAHLAWLKCHRPELYGKAVNVSMSTEYVIHRMTGRWVSDPSTATPFYLREQAGGQWYKPVLDKLEIPESKLPDIYPSGTAAGPLLPEAAERMGLEVGALVVLGAFDHPCAARGAGVLRPGQMLLSCGTSWVGLYPVERRDSALRADLLADPFLAPAGSWGAMFSFASIGKRLDAHIDEVTGGSPDKFNRFSALAASAEPGSGGLLLDPTADMDRGILDAYSQSRICRALMEGIAFLVKQKMDMLSGMGIYADTVVMAGGPSQDALWPKVMADVLGRQVAVVNGRCAGAVGAALLAGIGAGLFRDEADALERCRFQGKIYDPDSGVRAVCDDMYLKFTGR